MCIVHDRVQIGGIRSLLNRRVFVGLYFRWFGLARFLMDIVFRFEWEIFVCTQRHAHSVAHAYTRHKWYNNCINSIVSRCLKVHAASVDCIYI